MHFYLFIYFILRQATTDRSLECLLPVPAAIRKHYNHYVLNSSKGIRHTIEAGIWLVFL